MGTRYLFQHRLLWNVVRWGIIAALMVLGQYFSARISERSLEGSATLRLNSAQRAVWAALSVQAEYGHLNEASALALADDMRNALDLSYVRLTAPDGHIVVASGETQLFGTAQEVNLDRNRDGLTADTLASRLVSPLQVVQRANDDDHSLTSGTYTLDAAIDVRWIRQDIEQVWWDFCATSALWVCLFGMTCATEHYSRTVKRLKEKLGLSPPESRLSVLQR